MSIKVEDPGMLTTVQDLGRYGYQDIGVPPSGAVDNYALRVGNILVGNDEKEAGLEITFKGPTLLFQKGCLIAITGGDLQPQLNGEAISNWESFQVSAGDRISFGSLRSGMRTYIAFSGGVEVPKIMGSKSTYLRNQLGGFEGRALKEGDVIKIGRAKRRTVKRMPARYIPDYTSENLRVVLGPQDDFFTRKGIETFLSSEYKVTSESDRMGIRLEGPSIKHANGADIISDAIPLGGVQVPGNGKPIVLMVDRQTTGGYAKIATVISVDVDRLAQAKPGDKVTFKEISVHKAHKLLAEKEKRISALKENLKEKFKRRKAFRLRCEDVVYEVKIERKGEDRSYVWVDGERYEVALGHLVRGGQGNSLVTKDADKKVIKASLPGRVQKISVTKGEQVREGQALLILEALKMENDINSPIDGVVKKIYVEEGEEVEDGQKLLAVGKR